MLAAWVLAGCGPLAGPTDDALRRMPPLQRFVLTLGDRTVGAAELRVLHDDRGIVFERSFVLAAGTADDADLRASTRLTFSPTGDLIAARRHADGQAGYDFRRSTGSSDWQDQAVGFAPPRVTLDHQLGTRLLAQLDHLPPAGGEIIRQETDWQSLDSRATRWFAAPFDPALDTAPTAGDWALLDAGGQPLRIASGDGIEMRREWPDPGRPAWLLTRQERSAVAENPQHHLRPTPRLPLRHAEVRAAAAGLPALDDPNRSVELLIDRTHAALLFDAGIDPEPLPMALRRGRGSCVAFAELFTALARINGIPARVRHGRATPPGGSQSGPHAWSEVWIEGAWQEVDPSWRQFPADASHELTPLAALSSTGA